MKKLSFSLSLILTGMVAFGVTKGFYDDNFSIYVLVPQIAFSANNCTTKTVEAAAASGVSLPYEWAPQDLGLDLLHITSP
jgi:hypothetical protein